MGDHFKYFFQLGSEFIWGWPEFLIGGLIWVVIMAVLFKITGGNIQVDELPVFGFIFLLNQMFTALIVFFILLCICASPIVAIWFLWTYKIVPKYGDKKII